MKPKLWETMVVKQTETNQCAVDLMESPKTMGLIDDITTYDIKEFGVLFRIKMGDKYNQLNKVNQEKIHEEMMRVINEKTLELSYSVIIQII